MTAKEYLYQLKYIDDLINSNQEEVDRLRAMATNISVNYSDEPHASGTSDKVGNICVKIADLEREINALIDELINIKTNAHMLIKQIKGIRERTILTKMYINNKTLEQASVEMNISYVWAKKLHNMSLIEFDNVLNES